ncbi:MAG: MazG family protein [Planctomycetota bacterium]|jgi:MazG family protein
MTSKRSEALEQLLQVVDALREPGGCPWDRKQTVRSMAKFVLEEAYELVEAIELEDDAHTCEELGDLLMVLALISRIAQEAGRFDIEAATRAVHEKMIRRHPHVFGDKEAGDAEEALASWNSVKDEERAGQAADTSVLAGLPIGMPALSRAAGTCDKAVGASFRWKTAAGAWAKVEEELGELREALATTDLDAGPKTRMQGETLQRVQDELGDLLMATAFFGRYVGLDPEEALRSALRRFEGRFRHMEEQLDGPINSFDLPELMAAWSTAKSAGAGAAKK